MTALQGMGFSEIRSQKALLATGNSDPEVAMEWLFEHIEDPGLCYATTFKLVFYLTYE
jgi:ubiquitin carboxyl-terminal hydrolase 5/13